MTQKHSDNCPCPHCRGLDIPMQYALRPIHDSIRSLFAINESQMFEAYLEAREKGLNPPQPRFSQVMPKDENVFVIAYGMLHPQHESILNQHQITDLIAEFESHKNHAHCTLVGGKLRMSAFADFVLFPELSRDSSKMIPCALLLTTALDFKALNQYIKNDVGYGGFCMSDKERKFKNDDFAAFGYTTYLHFGNVKFFDNIINRPYLLCLRQQEELFDSANKDHWKDYIDVAKLMRLSRISY